MMTEDVLYRVFVSEGGDDQYSHGFQEFICTKKAMEQYKEKIFNYCDSNKIQGVTIKGNKIIINNLDGYYVIKFELFQPKVVTSVGDIEEMAWSCGGYDDTYLHIET